MQEQSLIIYAVNIHTGGGKILLDEILIRQVLGPIKAAFVDQRYNSLPNAEFSIFYSKNTFLDRIKAEYRLHQFIKNLPQKNIYKVLFFGNLPPLFKPQIPSTLYLQNCYLTRQIPLPNDSKKELLRNWLESIILKIFSNNVDVIWVQTSWMKKVTQAYLPKALISVEPILPSFKNIQLPQTDNEKFDLIYVGSLSLNKRLNFFIEVLNKLDDALKINIKVLMALDTTAVDLKLKKFNRIELQVLFKIPHDRLYEYYTKSKIYVATSLHESFCLPLYEAHNYNCQIIAPRTGYTENLNFPITDYDAKNSVELAEKILSKLI